MVTNFMQKMLQEAKIAVDNIKTAQLDNTAIDRFNSNIENVQLLLRDKKYHAMDKLQAIIAVKERLSKQQDVFEMSFNRYARVGAEVDKVWEYNLQYILMAILMPCFMS